MIFFWLYNIRHTTYRIEAKLNFNIDVYEKYILSIDSHQISVFKKIVICLWRTFISFLQRFHSFFLSLSQPTILSVAFNMGFSYQIYIYVDYSLRSYDIHITNGWFFPLRFQHHLQTRWPSLFPWNTRSERYAIRGPENQLFCSRTLRHLLQRT